MNDHQNNKIYQQASFWAEQLKVDSSFTNSDTEELKSHLIDLAEELRGKGLNEEEAFMIASSRLGDATVLKDAFEEVNSDIVQMRKAILVLSGIFAFFLLYFLLLFITRLLTIALYKVNAEPITNIRIVFYFVVFCHLLVIVPTLVIVFTKNIKIKKIESLKLKPQNAIVTYFGIVFFAVADLLLKMIIRAKFEPGSYTSNNLRTLFDYTGYSFPLVMIICFLLLFRKYYLSVCQRNSKADFATKSQTKNEGASQEIQTFQIDSEEQNYQVEYLKKNGLDVEEIYWILQKRRGLLNQSDVIRPNLGNVYFRFFLQVLSGVLVYFLLHFLLFSTTRILFTVLQYFENDALLNIKRTWSYVIVFQLFFIFFSISLYLRDHNVISLIKRLRFRPIYAGWVFFATIIFAIIDRSFYPISKYTIISNYNMKIKLSEVFLYSSYSFPFILCACFLMLFYKYYQDNVKIG